MSGSLTGWETAFTLLTLVEALTCEPLLNRDGGRALLWFISAYFLGHRIGDGRNYRADFFPKGDTQMATLRRYLGSAKDDQHRSKNAILVRLVRSAHLSSFLRALP